LPTLSNIAVFGFAGEKLKLKQIVLKALLVLRFVKQGTFFFIIAHNE
jgi:hypothetical protein